MNDPYLVKYVIRLRHFDGKNYKTLGLRLQNCFKIKNNIFLV